MWEEFLSLIFPEECVGCGKPGSFLCAHCERTIVMKPVAHSGTVATLFDYKNPIVRKAIWALKYHHRKSIGKYFGIALYREFFKHLTRTGKESGEIILIPIPSSKKGSAGRGYNHAEIIARGIAQSAKKDGFLIEVKSDLLHKSHETEQQARAKSRAEREKNVEGIFLVKHGEMIRGKTVILIDDVITSGATIANAKKALKVWGPKRLLAVAVAH